MNMKNDRQLVGSARGAVHRVGGAVRRRLAVVWLACAMAWLMWMPMRVVFSKKAPCYQGASWSQLLLAVCIICVIYIKGGCTV